MTNRAGFPRTQASQDAELSAAESGTVRQTDTADRPRKRTRKTLSPIEVRNSCSANPTVWWEKRREEFPRGGGSNPEDSSGASGAAGPASQQNSRKRQESGTPVCSGGCEKGADNRKGQNSCVCPPPPHHHQTPPSYSEPTCLLLPATEPQPPLWARTTLGSGPPNTTWPGRQNTVLGPARGFSGAQGCAMLRDLAGAHTPTAQRQEGQHGGRGWGQFFNQQEEWNRRSILPPSPHCPIDGPDHSSHAYLPWTRGWSRETKWSFTCPGGQINSAPSFGPARPSLVLCPSLPLLGLLSSKVPDLAPSSSGSAFWATQARPPPPEAATGYFLEKANWEGLEPGALKNWDRTPPPAH